MEYTAEQLYEMDVDTVTVIYPNGELDYFMGVSIGLKDYLDHDHADDVAVCVAPMNSDGSAREDLSTCEIEGFLEIVNSGNEVRFNETRDMTKFEESLEMDE